MKQVLVLFVLTVGVWQLSAQTSSKRHVEVTVTEPGGRFVTGLEQKSFEVVENGVPRPITVFSDVDSPIALAIVNDGALPDLGPLRPEDQLILASSAPDALRKLAASKNQRKIIVNLTSTELGAIPSGIEIMQARRADLIKAVIELHNQYWLEFESSTPSAPFAVVLKPPAGLPHLEVSWK